MLKTARSLRLSGLFVVALLLTQIDRYEKTTIVGSVIGM
jgi:hypothetical protein